MGQGDGAEREDEAGAGAGSGGPAVVGADGEDDGLRAGVAEPAEVSGEILAGELFATAVEQDENGSGASGLAVEPGEQGSLGGMGVGLTGQIAGSAGKVIGGEGGSGVGFGARAGRRDGR